MYNSTWKNWTTDPDEAIKNIIPLSIVYTPLGDSPAEYNITPYSCSNCRAILNECFYIGDKYFCSFCEKATKSEPRFNKEKEINSLEYVQSSNFTDFFCVILIDTTTTEIENLKSVLLQSITAINSEGVYVSIVLFSKHIYIFDFSVEHLRCVCLNGEKDYQINEVLRLLMIRTESKDSYSRYFTSIHSFNLNSVFESLCSSPFIQKGKRAERCTGSALKLSINLLKTAAVNKPGKILLVLSGIATIGPGKIVDIEFTNYIRSFADIKNNKQLLKPKEFYEDLSNDLRKTGHSIDIFSCSIDQSGLFELESLVQVTGGYMFLYDSLASPEFQTNFLTYIKQNFISNSKCSISVHCSSNVQVCGAIGPGYSLNISSKYNSSIPVGMSGTNVWGLNCIDSNTSLTFFFHPISKSSNKPVLIQFETRYLSPSGFKTRTHFLKFENKPKSADFSCETAAVVTAKLGVWRLKTEDFAEVARWVDKSLVSFAKRFSVIEGKTVTFPTEISLFPQFLYFLRRSQFLTNFNVSPDESAFFRQFLLRYPVSESLLMIQPVLLSYSFDSEVPEAQFLSPDAMKKDRILLMDSFFNVVLWLGEHVAAWVKAGYDKMPEYEGLKKLIEMSENDVEEIMRNRFPVPRKIRSKQRDGCERLLKVRMDTQSYTGEGIEIFNETMSIEAFFEKLKSLVIS